MNKNKFLIFIIDIVAISILITLLVVALKHTNQNQTLTTNSYNDGNIQEDNNNTVTPDTPLDNNFSNSSISDNSVSNNSVSNDSVSDDSASENSVSDNQSKPIYSYSLEGAPDIMNSPSGTVYSISQINTGSVGDYFIISPVPDDIFEYINGKSYRENNEISIDDLRYIKLLHYNFDHNVQVGELIVNASIANEMREIFIALFANGYEIQSMYLPDRYWTGDGTTTDTASCDANNTSAFFYRVVDGSSKLSNHAYGKAIDINPQQNPYVSYKTGAPECMHENALIYIDRTTGLPHLITETDICYQLFTSYGYSWGGSWTSIKDYQHFEK